MTVTTFEYLDDGEYLIYYDGAKRPLKFTPYVIDSDEADEFYEFILDYVAARANGAEHLRKMADVNIVKLIERFSTQICREESPTRKYGITKAEIRSVVRFALDELMRGETR